MLFLLLNVYMYQIEENCRFLNVFFKQKFKYKITREEKNGNKLNFVQLQFQDKIFLFYFFEKNLM